MDVLEKQDVPLRSWRVGGDVEMEASLLIKRNLKEMGVDTKGR